MLNRVKKVLLQNCALNNEQPIIVGVSGGADSLVLLYIIALDYPVVVAHFNHLLRPDAYEDTARVEMVSADMEVPFILGEGIVADYARENKISIEEAARELRYRFLFEQARKHDAQAVAVGHNADDQVETMVMHLLRGAGLDGLSGMSYHSVPNPWSKNIPIIRPLLGIWRSDIEFFCSEKGLKPVVDKTNSDIRFFRNRLRHKLIPELETYIPGIRDRLWQTADLLAADRNILNELTEDIWQEIVEDTDSGYLILNSSRLSLQPLGLQRRIIRKAISQLIPGARDVSFAMVMRVLDFLRQPAATRQADLGLGLRIVLEGNCLIISDWETALPSNHWPLISVDYDVFIPGIIDLGNGWTFEAEIPRNIESAKKEAKKNLNPFQVWFDLRRRNPFLNIRRRLPGDRFHPLGMEGKSMKISDFMINQKIPQRARSDWPLICSEGEIVWVPGYRLDHTFRVRETSRQIVKLSLRST